MKRGSVILWVILAALLGGETLACTTAVISGHFTDSGRPMIWKLRDTEEYRNHMRRFESPLGFYVGLMNDSDTEGEAIWGGHNSHGFGIMNSASFNVNQNDSVDIENQEGIIMKKALAECRDLSDFERLLDDLPKPMGLASHFGVIDAKGGAAFYEVNNYTWKKFDANEDPRGYVLRTNYSMTGTEDEGYGYVRYACASTLFEPLRVGTLSVQQIGSELSRSMYHGLLGIDYRLLAETDQLPSASGFIDSDDLIARYGTSSMILVEGVKEGEDPALTTSWVQIGNPYLSPLIPVWTWDEIPAELLAPEEETPKTMAQIAMELKGQLYPLRTVEESRYLYMPLIYRPDNSGLAQQLEALERLYIPIIVASSDRKERQKLQRELIDKSMAIIKSALSDR